MKSKSEIEHYKEEQLKVYLQYGGLGTEIET